MEIASSLPGVRGADHDPEPLAACQWAWDQLRPLGTALVRARRDARAVLHRGGEAPAASRSPSSDRGPRSLPLGQVRPLDPHHPRGPGSLSGKDGAGGWILEAWTLEDDPGGELEGTPKEVWNPVLATRRGFRSMRIHHYLVLIDSDDDGRIDGEALSGTTAELKARGVGRGLAGELAPNRASVEQDPGVVARTGRA